MRSCKFTRRESRSCAALTCLLLLFASLCLFQVARNCIAGQGECNPSFPCHGAAHCVPRVYPRLLGGLGNQLFIMSAAAIIADNLGGVVLLNSKQTGVYSSGAAQPVFWHSVFHSPLFVYEQFDAARIEAQRMPEEAFHSSLLDAFSTSSTTGCVSGIYLNDPFLSFDYFVSSRNFLTELYKPHMEMQRVVNDVAVKLDIAVWEELRPCDYPPQPCEHVIKRLSCSSYHCEDNIAIQLRLSDQSTPWDFWDEAQVRVVAKFILNKLDARKNVVIFSNDPKRALRTLGLQKLSAKQETRLKLADEVNFIEFFLMSQYFGTHILTGSTFQLWALFLSPLSSVKVLVLPESSHEKKEGQRPGTTDDLGFQATFENHTGSHLHFERLSLTVHE